jgi:superfamily II DNA/RNA helicase
VAEVARAVLARFARKVSPVAVCLTTPVPKRLALEDVRVSARVREFVTAYEPAVARDGLYSHQAEVLAALESKTWPNVVLTTATGSGKSLVFWAWVIEALRVAGTTAVLAFPTQALLWGQADRLRKISGKASLVKRGGQVYAGELDLKYARLPWTVWHGTQNAEDMGAHVKTEAFKGARIRLCTVDKVHWSLLQGWEEGFLRGLRAFVLDEAHYWYGYGGANVRGMFDRLRLSMDVLNVPSPAFFLASATLNGAREFAATLTGSPRDTFMAIDDAGAPRVRTLPAAQVPDELAPVKVTRTAELRRYVVMLQPDPAPVEARAVLGTENLIGSVCNAVCFVQSKFAGKRLRNDLARLVRSREAVSYDADIPSDSRRKLERELLREKRRGTTVVATSALELGVDLPSLDVAVIDDLPPRRADLIQRIGRVGRRADRPGLAVLCLGYSPVDDRLQTEPERVLSTDDIRPLPIPRHLESIRLKMMIAAFEEWRWRLQHHRASWDAFNTGLRRHFGAQLTYPDLKALVAEQLGDLIDISSPAWYYKGFRATVSEGKIPLIVRSTGSRIAMIEDTAIFRDAHPEGVFLGHRGQRYRVVGYDGRFKMAEWADARSNVVLGKFLHVLRAVRVVEERRPFATRGRWRDRFELYEAQSRPPGAAAPKVGGLEYGIWTFLRKFDGYFLIDLSGKQGSQFVSLGEVSRRFKTAMAAGEEFPFLHDFSYRTLGWRWKMARVVPDLTGAQATGVALAGVLQAFGCEAVECAHSDLLVTVDVESAELRVVDGTPGGNGLAAALLQDGRFSKALAQAVQALRRYAAQDPEVWRRFLAEECHAESEVPAQEVADVIDRMARAWGG